MLPLNNNYHSILFEKIGRLSITKIPKFPCLRKYKIFPLYNDPHVYAISSLIGLDAAVCKFLGLGTNKSIK